MTEARIYTHGPDLIIWNFTVAPPQTMDDFVIAARAAGPDNYPKFIWASEIASFAEQYAGRGESFGQAMKSVFESDSLGELAAESPSTLGRAVQILTQHWARSQELQEWISTDGSRVISTAAARPARPLFG